MEVFQKIVSSGLSVINIVPKDITMHYVYSVHDQSGEVVYIGHGRLEDIVTFARLRKDPSFDVTKRWTVVIAYKSQDRQEVMAMVRDYRIVTCGELNIPKFNKTAWINRRGKVKCNETGEVFRNAACAAKHAGVSSGNMSRHLTFRSGYKTINGKTYSYAEYYDDHLFVRK